MIERHTPDGGGVIPASAIAAFSTEYNSAMDAGVTGWTPAHEMVSAFNSLPTPAIIYQVRHSPKAELINEFQALGANWDGYDADPISEAACIAARSFLNALPGDLESPDLSPNPSGTISMEWESPNGDAQLELGKSKFSFYLRRRGARTIYHKGDAAMAATVCALLSALYATPRPFAMSSIVY